MEDKTSHSRTPPPLLLVMEGNSLRASDVFYTTCTPRGFNPLVCIMPSSLESWGSSSWQDRDCLVVL